MPVYRSFEEDRRRLAEIVNDPRVFTDPFFVQRRIVELNARMDREFYEKIHKIENTHPQEERTDMPEVGKVIIKEREPGNQYISSTPEESIDISMGDSSISLRIRGDNNKTYTNLTPEKAIELGQLLLKAAEVQTEYAAAAKDLAEQKKQLDAKYRDMISGLGLESVGDRLDADGKLKALS